MNNLQILAQQISTDKYRNIKDLYKCFCGKEFIARRAAVKSGHTSSCGCEKIRALKERMFKHGLYKSSEFHTWQAMIQRCTNPNNDRYKHYGARGIKVCPQWRTSFETFINDLGFRPKGMSLDRIDNDGDYHKENCRWIDIYTQNRNKRQRGKT